LLCKTKFIILSFASAPKFFFVKKKKNQQSLLSLQKQSKTFKAKPYIAYITFGYVRDVKIDALPLRGNRLPLRGNAFKAKL